MTTAMRLAVTTLTLAIAACAPTSYRPRPVDYSYRPPAGVRLSEPDAADDGQPTREADQVAPIPTVTMQGPLSLETVLASVTSRYPPLLSTLLERDLASGRLQQAMGSFDTSLNAKVGGQIQGFYESTLAQGLLEQPLASGDTIYGGYRISDGFLPDYDKDRTQDDGELVFGGRIPILRDRSIDSRRASVRKAEIDIQLAEPKILRARIDYVRAASKIYFSWVAAGRQLGIARELLRLATDRKDGLQRGVDRQFLAPIVVVDNDRLIAQREVFVLRAERSFQAAALELSLFLRDAEDRPIIAGGDSLPADDEGIVATGLALDRLEVDVAAALRQRPELRRFQLLVDKAKTDRDLADNQMQPSIDLIVEAASSLSNGPYKDRDDLELFVGGELKLPLQRRDARGRLEQANTQINRLRLEERFARDQIVNDVVDTRSALRAAHDQLANTRRNAELAQQLVAVEQRAFELGQSDLLRIQLREVQLADAQVLAVSALLSFQRAVADYVAAKGEVPAER